MSEDHDEDLSPEMLARVEKSIDDGVFLHPRQERGKPVDFHVTEAIVWYPGKPNELARVIIECCDRPMGLELDGHKYRIEPAGEGA